MSLFKDENFIEQLLRMAQAAPTAPPEALAVARKLIENLKKEPTTSKVTSDKGDVTITDPKVLRNLDNFLSFLNSNYIKYNNTALSLPPNASGQLNTELKSKNIYFPYPSSNIQDTPTFFVYKDGLISFIRDLQKQAAESQNKIMDSALGNLIGEVNSSFVKMSPREEAPQKEIRIDTLPDRMNSQNPFELGPKDLMNTTLLSKQKFTSFFENIPFVEENKEITLKNDPTTYISKTLAYLNHRANTWGHAYEGPQYEAYLSAMKNLNSLYTDLSAQQQSAQLSPQQQQTIASLPWPLFPNKIDVNQAKKFIESYNKITSDATYNYVLSDADNILTNYKIPAQILGGVEGAYPIQQKIDRANPGQKLSIFTYLDLLERLVGGAAGALTNLQTKLQASGGTQDLLKRIDEQLYYYKNNLDSLSQLEVNAKYVAQQGKG